MAFFRKKIPEADVAATFVRSAAEIVENAWPTIVSSAPSLSASLTSNDDAKFDFFLALVAFEAQAITNLFPAEQAERLLAWTMKALDAPDVGEYALAEVWAYRQAARGADPMSVLDGIPTRWLRGIIDKSHTFEAGGAKLVDPLLVMQVTALFVGLTGFWNRVQKDWKLVPDGIDVPARYRAALVQPTRATSDVEMNQPPKSPAVTAAGGRRAPEPRRPADSLLQGLRRQCISLDQFAERKRVRLPGGRQGLEGDAYAFDYGRLAERENETWHWTITRAALVVLATMRPKVPALAGYELLRGMVRFFVCGPSGGVDERGHAILKRIPGYIECGGSAVSLDDLRPVAFWTPPSKLVALWPLPIDDRPGPYALDAGGMTMLRSFPASDDEQNFTLAVGGHSADYMPVPDEPENRLEPEGIAYENRWAVLIESEEDEAEEDVEEVREPGPPVGAHAPPPVSRLECRAEDFVGALRMLAAAAKRGGSLSISFINGELHLTRGVTVVRVPATGTWSGEVKVSVQMIRDLLKAQKALPDALVIAANASRLSISHYSTPSW